MDSLDDEEDFDLDRLVVAAEPPPPRRFNARPLLIGLAVIVLGSGLGAGGYVLMNADSRDVIAMLDVADTPRLAMDMPGRGQPAGDLPPEPRRAEGPGELLTPPPAPSQGSAAAPAPPPVAAAPPPPPAPPAAALPPPPSAPPAAAPPEVKPAAEAKPEPAAAPAISPGATPPGATPPATPPPTGAAPAAPPSPAVAPVAPVPRNPEAPASYAQLPARIGEVKPLPPAPVEGLVQQGRNGALPAIGRDGKQPWQVYSRPFEDVQDRPRLAVLVTGLGLDKEATDAAIAKLPPEVTLSFSPYAGGLDKWIKKARDGGHEVMLDLPAEASGFPARDPGPMGLRLALTPEDNLTRLERVLGRAAGYVGVWVNAGPYTRSPQLAATLAALKARGLLYVGEGAAEEPRPPALAPAAAIDTEPFRDAIDSRLARIAEAAPEKGRMVVMAGPRPITFERLVVFLAALPDRGITLAPVSAVVRQGTGGKS
ncbi:divergent polysaccharide deacetylase family protein [Magnetospirillum sp. UT-4]|uniref:divergent polysaccharide deacetylase family protein n=1 Tax=Magnetospirillum sp. UT-4 TaxID=2681467 RepID=UPI0013830C34|nr:divergent polysaccharide deacetylase family protein [Magnetospirillum sp. UT-4]CAA7617544.1 conserved hypothetical protein [Magnetospirillum sp. UT-4]